MEGGSAGRGDGATDGGAANWRGDVIVVRDVGRDMIGVRDVWGGEGGDATGTDELNKVLLLEGWVGGGGENFISNFP